MKASPPSPSTEEQDPPCPPSGTMPAIGYISLPMAIAHSRKFERTSRVLHVNYFFVGFIRGGLCLLPHPFRRTRTCRPPFMPSSELLCTPLLCFRYIPSLHLMIRTSSGHRRSAITTVTDTALKGHGSANSLLFPPTYPCLHASLGSFVYPCQGSLAGPMLSVVQVTGGTCSWPPRLEASTKNSDPRIRRARAASEARKMRRGRFDNTVDGCRRDVGHVCVTVRSTRRVKSLISIFLPLSSSISSALPIMGVLSSASGTASMTKGVCSLACWYDTVVASVAAGKAGPLPVCLAIAGIVEKKAEEDGGVRTDQARKFTNNMDIIGVQDGHNASCLAGTFVFSVIFSTSSSVVGNGA